MLQYAVCMHARPLPTVDHQLICSIEAQMQISSVMQATCYANDAQLLSACIACATDVCMNYLRQEVRRLA
jgi:hypothetical protein